MTKTTKIEYDDDDKTVKLRYQAADDGCDTLIHFKCPDSPQQVSV